VRCTLAAEIAMRREYTRLLRRCDRLGIVHFEMEDGTEWYPIPRRWRSGAFTATPTDLKRLRELVAQKSGPIRRPERKRGRTVARSLANEKAR